MFRKGAQGIRNALASIIILPFVVAAVVWVFN